MDNIIVTMNVIPRSFGQGIVHPHEKKRRETCGHSVSVDYGEALHQWGALSTRLLDAGAKIVSWYINQDLPDGGFIQDNGYVLWDFSGNCWRFIGLRMGPPKRQEEEKQVLETAAKQFDHIIPWEEPGTLEGGDIYPSVILNDIPTVFIGLRENADKNIPVRTDLEGIKRFTSLVGLMGYRVVIIPFWDTLHLTSIGSFLGLDQNGQATVLIDSSRCDTQPFEANGVRVLDLPADAHGDAWGVNAIRINNHLIIQKGYPSIELLLRKEGFDNLVFVPWTQLRMVDGSLTCCCIIQAMPFGCSDEFRID